MKSNEIEDWALQIIDQVVNNKPNEDSRIELKTGWIDPKKAARRIAGHANSCQGEPILWLIGVDEKSQSVPGVSPNELSIWYSQVKSQFDGIAPSLVDLNVPYKDVVVVALYFDASRIPYVVKNPDGGKIQFEVPWREGTQVRTARREDLVKLLTPVFRIPKVEFLSAHLSVSVITRKPDYDSLFSYKWDLIASFYIEADIGKTLVIPFHRCKVEGEIDDKKRINFSEIGLYPPLAIKTKAKIIPAIPSGHAPKEQVFSETVKSTNDELIISGPGKIYLRAKLFSNKSEWKNLSKILITVTLPPIQTSIPIQISFNLAATQPHGIISEEEDEIARWSS